MIDIESNFQFSTDGVDFNGSGGRLNTDNHCNGKLLTRLKLFGEGVEVGTNLGDWANHTLSNWPGKKLWCVDSYTVYPESDYTQKEFDNIYETVKKRLSIYGSRVEIIRKSSVKASEQFENESLDFVYIDANHSEASVMMDLETWYPKVKSGGLFFGDDYRMMTWPGVTAAVDKFCKTNKLAAYFDKSGWAPIKCSYSWEEDGLDNWYIFK